MKKFILFFILVIFFKISLTDIIKIPFGIINTEKDSDSYSLISKLVYNRLYINFTIGTPPQNIKLYLRKDSYALFINELNFNKDKSDSFESKKSLETFF